MPLLYGHTGQVLLPDGIDAPARLGNEGQLVMSRLHGTHYEAARRGSMFISSTVVAGLAIPISTTTAPVMALWNPAGSGYNAVLVSFNAAYVSGLGVATEVGLSYVFNAGAEIATGAAFSAFNKTTPVNALLNKGNASKVFSSNAGTNTLTTAGTFFYTMGVPGNAAATTTGTALDHLFDGRVIVPPGAIVYPVSSVASVALYAMTLVWEEVPA